MQNRIIELLGTFILLFSLQGFSQTTDKSDHPLLDKYYPQKQNVVDTPKATTTRMGPVIETKPAPALVNKPLVTPPPVVIVPPVVTPPPIVTPAPALATTSVETPAPVADTTAVETAPIPVPTKTLPAVTTTSSITTTSADATLSPVLPTPVINKPAAVTARIPVQKVIQPQSPPAPPYIDTRLGSSTKAYDTWEKNNNGAGSVTTSPK